MKARIHLLPEHTVLCTFAWCYRRRWLPNRNPQRCTIHASCWAAVQTQASSQAELPNCLMWFLLNILTYCLVMLQGRQQHSLQFTSNFSHILSNHAYSLGKVMFSVLSLLYNSYKNQMRYLTYIKLNNYFSSLHISSEKNTHGHIPLPDAYFLKLLQHLQASCSGANTWEHILWFQVKPYIITMAFPQFPLLRCLGLLYHCSNTNNPSSFSIPSLELSYKESENQSYKVQ